MIGDNQDAVPHAPDDDLTISAVLHQIPPQGQSTTQSTTQPSLEQQTREFLDKNNLKSDLQKRCRQLGIKNVWTNKSQLIEMIMEKSQSTPSDTHSRPIPGDATPQPSSRDDGDARLPPPSRDDGDARLLSPTRDDGDARLLPPSRDDGDARLPPSSRDDGDARLLTPSGDDGDARVPPPSRDDGDARLLPPSGDDGNARLPPPSRDDGNTRLPPSSRDDGDARLPPFFCDATLSPSPRSRGVTPTRVNNTEHERVDLLHISKEIMTIKSKLATKYLEIKLLYTEMKTAYNTIEQLQQHVIELEQHQCERGDHHISAERPAPPSTCLLLGDTNLSPILPSDLHHTCWVRTIHGANMDLLRSWVSEKMPKYPSDCIIYSGTSDIIDEHSPDTLLDNLGSLTSDLKKK